MTSRNDQDHLIGVRTAIVPESHGSEIAWNDSKIKFVTDLCAGKEILDLGCVQHDPSFSKNKFWLHKAIQKKAKSVLGLDLFKEGVDELNAQGYNIIHGDAQNFSLDRTFEVIVAGDLIEHLSNFAGFFESCAKHMNDQSTLIICTPNPWHWHKVLKAALGPVPVNEEHTCWVCPKTLEQLAGRFSMELRHVEYGSTRRKDSFLPIPTRLRHASWYAELQLKPSASNSI